MPKAKEDDEELPEHPDAEFFVNLFYKYGVGILGDRGLPSPGAFQDALPLIGVSLKPNIDLLYDIFMAAASGLIKADRESREEREAARANR